MTDPWLVQSTEKDTDQAQNASVNNLNSSTELETSIEQTEVIGGSNNNKQALEFEDNFAPTTTNQNNNNNNTIVYEQETQVSHQPLPDSAVYLEGLERKLKKLRKSSKLVEALAAKREDCMRELLDENTTTTLNADQHDVLNAPISNGDSAVHELYRHLQPVQPVTVGEIVHIVKYDQLEDDKEEEQNGAE